MQQIYSNYLMHTYMDDFQHLITIKVLYVRVQCNCSYSSATTVTHILYYMYSTLKKVLFWHNETSMIETKEF